MKPDDMTFEVVYMIPDDMTFTVGNESGKKKKNYKIHQAVQFLFAQCHSLSVFAQRIKALTLIISEKKKKLYF